jgi:type IV fimbrial biogenesis protein FimT
MPCHRQSGLTLVELALSLSIAGLLLCNALPALSDLMQRMRLQSVADLLRADIQEARSQAVMRRGNLQMHFESDANGTCYIVHAGGAGACRCTAAHEAQCLSPARAIRTQWLPASLQIALAGGKDMTFAAGQGTVTPAATLVLRNGRGDVIHQIISGAGRVRACAPGARFGALPACAA